MSTPVPPKILNLNAPSVRNQRTLVWLQKQVNTVPWSKWDGIVTSLSDYHKWSSQANIVGIVIITLSTDIDTFLKELLPLSKKLTMILLPSSILEQKSEDFWLEHFDNILLLDTILSSYPFLVKPWDRTAADAVAMFALLCRYHRVVDCQASEERKVSQPDISYTYNEIPGQAWMITQFFRHSDAGRHKEIKECLVRNCACPHLNQIVLLNETDLSSEWNQVHKKGPLKGKLLIPGAEKIKQIIIGKRLLYADFLKYVKDSVPANVYTILCNADIYFGDSLLELWKMKMEDRMLALLRWDIDEMGQAKLFGPRADSQDAWIFLSQSIKQRTWNQATFGFSLGQPGCDNAFAGHILRQGFLLSNPGLTFQTFHLHQSNVRNYSKKDYIKSDLYINLAPTYIIDTKQESLPVYAPQCICNELVSFEVKSSSMSNEITYCTMLEKAGRYQWEPSVENHYFEPAIPVYSWKNACVSPNGLVYDLYHIYTGKHQDEPRFNYWKEANVSIFTPLQPQKKMIAIPFMNTALLKHPDTYILHYFSRCMRLRTMYPDASFWIHKPFLTYLSYFQCDMPSCPLFDDATACWCDEVVGFLPGPSSSELGMEDITCLRQMLPSWKEKPTEKVCTIILDDVLTMEYVNDRMVPFLLEKNEEWTIRVISEEDYASYDALIGSSLCILVGGQDKQEKWAKLWALPQTCCLIEFQQELQIDGECQHLAHISGLQPWILLLSKGRRKDVQDQIMEQLEKWWKKNSTVL